MLTAKIVRKTKGGGLGAILAGLPKAVESGTKNALEKTKQYAIAVKNSNTGDSSKKILIEMVRTDNQEVVGRVYTDFFYAAFLEYGTGVFMEPNPLGHIPGSAGEQGLPWFVHVDTVDLSRYHFPIYESVTGDRYYMIRGTHAHPYMKPAGEYALKASEEELIRDIREMIGRAAK